MLLKIRRPVAPIHQIQHIWQYIVLHLFCCRFFFFFFFFFVCVFVQTYSYSKIHQYEYANLKIEQLMSEAKE